MIRATSTGLHANVSGPAVYLDNWAIGDLAEESPTRRRRFVDAILSGMDLLFSVTNAAELSGPQGQSADAVRSFLDELGPHWFPVELDQTEVVNRELKGVRPEKVCIAEEFLMTYFAFRTRNSAGKVIALSDDFFRLGAVLDWVGPQRESISKGKEGMDEGLKNKIAEYAENSKREPLWLDKTFPPVSFNPSLRAYFVYVNLVRQLILDATSLKSGDGMDFCHAVMACAYASFATLDMRWKRRSENLPKPNQIARIYSKPDLDKMVADMESWVAHRAES